MTKNVLILTTLGLLFVGCGPSQREARHRLAAADIPFTEAEFAKHAGAGNRDTLQLFFDAGMEPNVAKEREVLPLVQAAEAGHVEIVNLLLKRGAVPNGKTKRGRTALIAATAGEDTMTTSAERIEMVRRLLEAGANPNAVYMQRGLASNEWPRSSLYYAGKNGYIKIVRLLLEAGARPEGKKDETLMATARKGHDEIVNLLAREDSYSPTVYTWRIFRVS